VMEVIGVSLLSINPDMELVIFTIRFWMHRNLGKNFLNFDYHFS